MYRQRKHAYFIPLRGNMALQSENIFICTHPVFFVQYSDMEQISRTGFLRLGTNTLSIFPAVSLLSWEHELRNENAHPPPPKSFSNIFSQCETEQHINSP